MPSDMSPPLSPDSTRLYSAVDRSNETYEPSPHAARRTIPSGRVSPDGKRAWPQPSLTSRIIVFGGMGIAAAAATAGAVLAVRAIVDAVAGDDDDDLEAARQRARARRHGQSSSARPSSSRPQRPSPARFADMDYDSSRAERERAERSRREAARRRNAGSHGSSGSVVESVNETVASVTSGVRDVLATVTAAIEGFRSVAAQAGDVMADFNKAADQVKSMIEPATPRRPSPGSYTRPGRKDVVDLREGEAPSQAAGNRTGQQDTRSHRL